MTLHRCSLMETSLGERSFGNVLKGVLCGQVRVPIEEVPQLLRQLTDMDISWDQVQAKYPAQQSGTEGTEE